MKPRYDTLWKGIIEEVIDDVLHFVEPGIEWELDVGRGVEFLDKELADLYPEPEKPAGTMFVDKLIKVFLRDGAEQYMLLHFEIQGKKEKDFGRRMFDYYIRLLCKHRLPVAAIAIYTGKNGSEMPAVFETRCLWTRTRFEFKPLCITNYSTQQLKASRNPFAAVMMVAQQALLSFKGTDEERDQALLEQKLMVARFLKQRMLLYGPRKTKAILTFLTNYVTFRLPETNVEFKQHLDNIFKKRKTMGFFEVLEADMKEDMRKEMEKEMRKDKKVMEREMEKKKKVMEREMQKDKKVMEREMQKDKKVMERELQQKEKLMQKEVRKEVIESIEKAKIAAIRKAKEMTTNKAIRSFLKMTQCSTMEIAKALGVSVEQVRKIKRTLSPKRSPSTRPGSARRHAKAL